MTTRQSKPFRRLAELSQCSIILTTDALSVCKEGMTKQSQFRPKRMRRKGPRFVSSVPSRGRTVCSRSVGSGGNMREE